MVKSHVPVMFVVKKFSRIGGYSILIGGTAPGLGVWYQDWGTVPQLGTTVPGYHGVSWCIMGYLRVRLGTTVPGYHGYLGVPWGISVYLGVPRGTKLYQGVAQCTTVCRGIPQCRVEHCVTLWRV